MLGRSNSVGRYIAPVRERGLKYVQSNSRAENIFAPVRERGLKLSICFAPVNIIVRSRKGAWIEISVRAEFGNDPRSLP